MIDTAFVQTGLDGPWVECKNERSSHEDIENLDCAFLIQYSDEYEYENLGKRFRLFRPGNHLPSDFSIGTEEENRRLFQEVRAHADVMETKTDPFLTPPMKVDDVLSCISEYDTCFLNDRFSFVIKNISSIRKISKKKCIAILRMISGCVSCHPLNLLAKNI